MGISFYYGVAYTGGMSVDEFDKLFRYMQDMRGEMNDRFDAQDEKIADLTVAIAEKTGVTLSYDA